MVEQLTLAFRPSSFSEVVGNRVNAVVLQQMVDTDSVPNALLFSGPRGTGKTSAARILAVDLNPEDKDEILSGTSLSVIEIDAASNGSVADMRSLIDQLRFEVGAKNRVVILDEAHSITRDGFNALLKTLEEPPFGVTFVLVTTEPQRLPDTVLSRLTEFEFRRISAEDILTRLRHIAAKAELDVPDPVLFLLAEDADGSARDAVKNLDFVVRAGIRSEEDYASFFGKSDMGPVLLAALLKGDRAVLFDVLEEALRQTRDARVVTDELARTISDIFVLQAGGEVHRSTQAVARREKLAKAVSGDDLLEAVRVLWDLKTKIRHSDDPRTFLSMALVIMTDKFSSSRKPELKSAPEASVEVVSKEEAPRPLSLSEIMQT